MKYLYISLMLIMPIAFKQPASSTLTIITGNYNNDKGKAILFLFRKDDKIPSSPFKTVSTEIKNKKAVFEIPNVAFGDYAILILHDENNNGEIDHSMGLPNEQLGYSNKWEIGFFTGMPTFEKLRFQFSATQKVQNISITYKRNRK